MAVENKIRYIRMNGADYISNGMVADALGITVEEVIAKQQEKFGRTSVDQKAYEQKAPVMPESGTQPRTIYIAE